MLVAVLLIIICSILLSIIFIREGLSKDKNTPNNDIDNIYISIIEDVYKDESGKIKYKSSLVLNKTNNKIYNTFYNFSSVSDELISYKEAKDLTNVNLQKYKDLLFINEFILNKYLKLINLPIKNNNTIDVIVK